MSPHNTRDEFRQLLKAENIDAIFRINPVGRIYGVTFIDHNEGIVANGSVRMSSTNCIRLRNRRNRLQNDTRNRNTSRKAIRRIR